MERVWKDIVGYNGKYKISNDGLVKSTVGNEKILKPFTTEKGYLKIRLSKKGKEKNYRIHRLVAEAFIPNPNNYPQVNHKDECKTNNTVWINEDGSIDQEKSNLEWCTNEYNVNYGTHNQRISNSLTNGKRSKQVYQYSLDGKIINIWSSAAECERIDNFKSSAVSACCRNKFNIEGNNIYKGYRWSYTTVS